MKKIIVLTLCTLTTLSLVACGGNGNASDNLRNGAESSVESPMLGDDPATWSPNASTDVEVANPLVEGTLADAILIVGFDFVIPEAIDGYTNRTVMTINGELIQAVYGNDTESDVPDNIMIRKAKGSDDISGDYNEYAEVDTVSVGEIQVTLNGNDGKVNVAMWTDNGYTFSIVANTGLTNDQMTDLVSSTK